MRDNVIAGNIDRCFRHKLADGLLRPVHGFSQRRPSHSDADMLHGFPGGTPAASQLWRITACKFSRPCSFAHTRQLAACTRSLAQQLRAVADSAVCLGIASGIDSQVQWHD